ncbi:hypothetical protein [Nocardioides sp.]|uniref:hypothetical protein n=1 Tax=Nocardioides sp. TaxID=35761 RepID=UPI002635DA93|nr:hypothetical protein [Nocardioides sp.]
MNLRRITLGLGATAGALALALAPAMASASTPPADLQVGGTHTNDTFSATGKPGVTANIPGYGLVTCTSASATGNVYPGAPVPTTWADISTFSLSCPSIIPGATVAITLGSCGNIGLKNAAGTATTPVTDNPITGDVDFGTAACPKVHVNFAGFCSFDLYSSTTGTPTTFTFDENNTTAGQPLTLDGDLTIANKSGLLCTSVITNGKNITLHVPLNVKTGSGGLINFL